MKKQRRAYRSLRIILWLVFTVFAIVLILVFLALQSLLVGQSYRAQTVDSVQKAGEEMGEAVAAAGGGAYKVWGQQSQIEETYDVTIRFLDPDGNVLLIEDDGKYTGIVREVEGRLSGGDTSTVLMYENAVIYATAVTLEGQRAYLCVLGFLTRIHALESNLWLMSLVTALFAVVLAFVVSAFVSNVITRPVSEVTARAKELARGQYDIAFRGDYFCMEIAELSDALDYAREEISKADTMQKELIANVSHDFKTPLTMIKAYASMIREISGEVKEKRDAHAQIIEDEADRLSSLVDDLLDLSRIRAGVGVHPPQTFNLSELVYKIVDKFDYLTQTQGYVIEQQIEESLYTYADRERIEQVVYNLVGNAVNYTGDDKRVTVSLAESEGRIRFEVHDTGKGIPPEELPNIWDRYYRSRETHKRPVRGTGLGLSIVKNILISQGCPFGVDSEVGKGSCFWVEFASPPEAEEQEGMREKLGEEDKS